MGKDERSKVKDRLRNVRVRPSKERGQNFLVDPSGIDKIVQFGRPKKGDHLLEIGPGLGALTSELVHYGDLTVIEIEENFCVELKKKHSQIDVIQEDVRLVSFSDIADKKEGKKIVVFGNLPYSFSTDIVFHLVDNAPHIDRAVLLLQKEFAARLAAPPGSRTYGTLSISGQLFSEVRLGPILSGDSFQPRAKVDSQVVQLKFYDKPKYEVDNLLLFKRVVKAAFYKRRRMILNSLEVSEAFSQIPLKSVLDEASISPEARAESISIESYAHLSNIIERHIVNDK